MSDIRNKYNFTYEDFLESEKTFEQIRGDDDFADKLDERNTIYLTRIGIPIQDMI